MKFNVELWSSRDLSPATELCCCCSAQLRQRISGSRSIWWSGGAVERFCDAGNAACRLVARPAEPHQPQHRGSRTAARAMGGCLGLQMACGVRCARFAARFKRKPLIANRPVGSTPPGACSVVARRLRWCRGDL